MSKGGGATTTPAAPATAPETNALKHLLDMLGPETFGDKKDSAGNAGQTQMPAGGTMPVMNPQAWTQLGAGNFMPSTTNLGGGGGSKGGGGSISAGGAGKGGAG